MSIQRQHTRISDRRSPARRDRPGVEKPDLGLATVGLFGHTFKTGRFEDAADFIVTRALDGKSNRSTIVFHMNVNNYYQFQKNTGLMHELDDRYVMLFDGIGMKTGAFLLGQGWLPDLNGTDLFPLVMNRGAPKRLRVFLFGGKKEIVERCSRRIEVDFPGVNLAGCRPGYFCTTEERDIISQINRARPQLLLSGMGILRELDFTLRNEDSLDVPLIWNVGGLFDFISGCKPRAPRLMRRMRLEWLFRLLLEPRRMFHRYVLLAPWFLGHVVRRKL